MAEPVIGVSLLYVAGDDVELEFTTTDEDGAAENISGATITFAMVRPGSSTVVIGTGDATATASITSASTGVFKITISSANTANLSGDYQYQVRVTDTGSKKTTVARGYITFDASIL